MLALLVRLVGARHSRHVVALLGLAVACVVAGGALFAATQHLPFTTGLYWAITTATTVGYGDVTPHNPAGRLIASAVMLTTIPLLAAVFALVTGAAAAAGVRRVLALVREFPAGTYRIVIGMHPAVPAILEELVRAGDAVVLVADVDPDTVPDRVHLIRRDPTQPGALRGPARRRAARARHRADRRGRPGQRRAAAEGGPRRARVGPGPFPVGGRGPPGPRHPPGGLG